MRRSAAVLLAAGCAHVGPPPPPVAVPSTKVTLEAEVADDAIQLSILASLTAEATEPLERWGGLQSQTRIVVVPSHAALEERAHRPGFSWLRAWARFDVVYLQSPRTWGGLTGPSRSELRDMLTHELAHCLMYQAVSAGDDWQHKNIPLWFREGFASWTAQQAPKRLSAATLSHVLQSEPTLDPLGNAEALYRADEPIVYAAAHWAFARLWARGEPRVRDLLAAMHDGWSFEVAFAKVYGEEISAFEKRTLEELRHAPGAAQPALQPVPTSAGVGMGGGGG